MWTNINNAALHLLVATEAVCQCHTSESHLRNCHHIFVAI